MSSQTKSDSYRLAHKSEGLCQRRKVCCRCYQSRAWIKEIVCSMFFTNFSLNSITSGTISAIASGMYWCVIWFLNEHYNLERLTRGSLRFPCMFLSFLDMFRLLLLQCSCAFLLFSGVLVCFPTLPYGFM